MLHVSLHIYTFLASFVPHLKIPRFVQQKAILTQIISAPRQKIRYRNS